MSKIADYLISGVWFSANGSKRVTHVLLHKDTDSGFELGQKKTEAEVIKLIDAGYSVKTAIWNYKSAGLSEGAEVGYEEKGTQKILRTHKDGTVTDNLDNMLNMGWLI